MKVKKIFARMIAFILIVTTCFNGFYIIRPEKIISVEASGYSNSAEVYGSTYSGKRAVHNKADGYIYFATAGTKGLETRRYRTVGFKCVWGKYTIIIGVRDSVTQTKSSVGSIVAMSDCDASGNKNVARGTKVYTGFKIAYTDLIKIFKTTYPGVNFDQMLAQDADTILSFHSGMTALDGVSNLHGWISNEGADALVNINGAVHWTADSFSAYWRSLGGSNSTDFSTYYNIQCTIPADAKIPSNKTISISGISVLPADSSTQNGCSGLYKVGGKYFVRTGRKINIAVKSNTNFASPDFFPSQNAFFIKATNRTLLSQATINVPIDTKRTSTTYDKKHSSISLSYLSSSHAFKDATYGGRNDFRTVMSSTFSSTNATYILSAQARARNKAQTGNQAGPATSANVQITVDGIAPSLSVPTSGTTRTITASDSLSGLKQISIEKDGTVVKTSTTSPLSYAFSSAGQYAIIAIDNVGNSKEQVVTISPSMETKIIPQNNETMPTNKDYIDGIVQIPFTNIFYVKAGKSVPILVEGWSNSSTYRPKRNYYMIKSTDSNTSQYNSSGYLKSYVGSGTSSTEIMYNSDTTKYEITSKSSSTYTSSPLYCYDTTANIAFKNDGERYWLSSKSSYVNYGIESYLSSLGTVWEIRVDGKAPIIDTVSSVIAGDTIDIDIEDEMSGLDYVSITSNKGSTLSVGSEYRSENKYIFTFTIPTSTIEGSIFTITARDRVGNVSTKTFTVNSKRIDIDNFEIEDNSSFEHRSSDDYIDGVYAISKNNYWLRQNYDININMIAESVFSTGNDFVPTNEMIFLRDSSKTSSLSTDANFDVSLKSNIKNSASNNGITTYSTLSDYVIKLENNILTSKFTTKFLKNGGSYFLTPKSQAYNSANSLITTTAAMTDMDIKINIDGIAPTLTQTLVSNDVGILTYKFDATDLESGLNHIEIVDENGLIYDSTIKNSLQKTFNDAGIYKVRAIDNVGNISTEKTITILERSISVSKPEISDTTNNYSDGVYNAGSYYWVNPNKDINISNASYTTYQDNYFKPTLNELIFTDLDTSLETAKVSISISNPGNVNGYTTSNSNVFKTSEYVADNSVTKTLKTNFIGKLGNGLTAVKKYSVRSTASSIYNSNVLANIDYFDSITLYTDKIAPIISTPIKFVSGGKVYYTFSATDNESGFAEMKIFNGTTVIKTSTLSTFNYNFTESGTYTLKAYDKVGNISAIENIKIIKESVDVNSFAITSTNNISLISSNNYWIKNGSDITFNMISSASYDDDIFKITNNNMFIGSDTTKASAVYILNPNNLTIQGINKNTTEYTLKSFNGIKKDNIFESNQILNFIKTSGTYVITPYAKSVYSGSLLCEDIDTTKNIKVNIDSISPTIATPTKTVVKNGYSCVFSASDTQSGLSKIELYNGSTLVTSSTNNSFTYTILDGEKYTIMAYDKVGNVSTLTFATEKIDISLDNIKITETENNETDGIYKQNTNTYYVKPGVVVPMSFNASTTYADSKFRISNMSYLLRPSTLSAINLSKYFNAEVIKDISTNAESINNANLSTYSIINNTFTLSSDKKNLNSKVDLKFISKSGTFVLTPYAKVVYNNEKLIETSYDSSKNINILLDNIKPAINISNIVNGINKKTYTIIANDTLSGVKSIEILKGSTTLKKNNTNTITYDFLTSGAYTIKAIDNVGNINTLNIDVDVQAPIIYNDNKNISSGNSITVHSDKLNLNIKVTDNLSGVKNIKIKDSKTKTILKSINITEEKTLLVNTTYNLLDALKLGYTDVIIEASDYQDNLSSSVIIHINNDSIFTTYIDTNAGTKEETITLVKSYLYDLKVVILNDPRYQIGSEYKIDNIEKYSLQGFNTNKTATKGYKPLDEIDWFEFKENATSTINDTSFVTLYTAWDKFPVINCKDIYFSLKDAQDGLITEEKIKSFATGVDKEDGNTVINLIGYDNIGYKQFTEVGSVSETYSTIDSVGNNTVKTINVHIVEVGISDLDYYEFVRFISPQFYDKTELEGGLKNTSIWRTNTDYAQTLENSMKNIEKDKQIKTYDFYSIHKEKEIDGTGNWDNIVEEYFMTTDDIRNIRTEMAKLTVSDYEKENTIYDFYLSYIKKYKIS